mgnify:CR=1 FL=1
MPGILLSPEYNAQVMKTVKAYLDRIGYEQPTGTPSRHVRRSTHVGFLTSAIAAATDPRLGWEFQPTGTFNIWQHDATGALADTSEELTVYSKRDAAFVSDTYIEVEYKAGVWQLVDANCGATSL